MPQPQIVTGGGLVAGSVYSGVVPATGLPGDVQLVSGAGRLNLILPHTTVTSGLTTVFYDAAVATSGGPFAASGHVILGVIPPTWTANSGVANAPQARIVMEVPYRSGLCVNLRSGQLGFTYTYTPEINKN